MKANVSNLRYGDKLRQNRKENHFYSQLALIDPASGREVVTARFYGTLRGSTVYACIWVRPCDLSAEKSAYGLGGGKAGGYGYHKASAALAEAISDAGITLDESITGRGDAPMESALYAIAKANTGKRKFFMVRAHG
ncbi:MAG: hypothetical protein AAFX78_02685 [Cyanobacteria bacterium J06638_20]